jgi:hypothetical protein
MKEITWMSAPIGVEASWIEDESCDRCTQKGLVHFLP